MLKAFKPHMTLGIEPSPYAFKKDKPDKLRPLPSTELKLYDEDLVSWSKTKRKEKEFHLGICTSVFQYLKD
jgi:hypothetical protein